MNESILEALMRLFALVAFVNEKGQPGIERAVVKDYLHRQFSSSIVEKYLRAFDKYLTEYHPDLTLASHDEKREQSVFTSRAVNKLCNKLNTELETSQKVIVLIYLLDFIESGNDLSSYQFRFIEGVSKGLNIPHEDYLNARYFTFDELDKIGTPENILIIDGQESIIHKEHKHQYIPRMEGRFFVLHIADTNTLVFRYSGNETIFLNGHNIKEHRSYIWAPGSVIKNNRFGAVYYIWAASQFNNTTKESHFVFEATNIEFSYGNSHNGLKRFNLNEESGRLIGIIGGSGSGKSTLLKVLAGIIKPDHGTIKINGYDIHKQGPDIEGLIGYVPQDDFLIKELTVFENLYYTAKLSFSNYSEENIFNLVDKALIDFDLVEARDLQVGDSLNTYLSGGQRKRLNIALELLREPAVLFIDEPTSGLSSMDSEKVMTLLKRQTIKGKLVFANIHQPSSDIFKQLDKLLVVDQGGRVIWYGNPIDAITYVKKANHYADYETSECLTCGNINAEQILRNVEARIVDVNGRLTRNRKTSPQEWYNLYMKEIDPIIQNIKREHTSIPPESNFSPPTRWEQIKLYFKRDLKAKLKNQQYLLVTLLEAPVLALLLAFYTRSSRDIEGNITNYAYGLNHNIPAFIFMSVIVALFLGLIISAEEIFKDRKLLERERFLNLSRSGYLFSKAFILFTISAIQMLSFVLISHYLLEIKGMQWRYFLLLFSTSCWANIIGLNISSGFKSVITIYILVPLILVPQLLFSGVVVEFNNLNRTIQAYKYVPAIGDAMTSRWAYEGLMVTQFRDNKYEKPLFKEEQNMSNAQYMKSYDIPYLLDQLEDLFKTTNTGTTTKETEKTRKLLANEIKKLNTGKTAAKKEICSLLEQNDLNEENFNKVKRFLEHEKEYQNSIYIHSLRKKDIILRQLIEEKGGASELTDFKNRYANSQLAKLVRNEKELMPYFIFNDQLIKLKDPIFTIPDSKNGRAHFYAPVKNIGGKYFDTYWFNMLVIWIASLFFFVVLYFDILLKAFKYFENLRLRRFNRQFLNAVRKQQAGSR